MKNVDFYEFVALVIPGSVFLVGFGYLFDTRQFHDLLAPQTFGNLSIHLLLAYVIGHLLQAIGNWIEAVYWRPWRGMPTDWPISRNGTSQSTRARSSLVKFCGYDKLDDAVDLDTWRGLVAQARSTIYAAGRSGRLQFFNGNYGMFRGLLAAEGTLAVLALWAPVDRSRFYPLALLVIGLTGYRMHRFSVHYAREFYAVVAELARATTTQGRTSA